VLTADGRTAYSASVAGEVVRWDLAAATSTTLFTQAANPDIAGLIALSPDETHLATAGSDHAVRITDLATGHGRVASGHSAEINGLAFSPDGRTVASASDDNTVRLWDVASGEGRRTAHHEQVYALVFADDAHLVTATAGGTISVILDDVPRDEAGLRAFLDAATNLVVDPEAR
jgi:WD40 repeat protein